MRTVKSGICLTFLKIRISWIKKWTLKRCSSVQELTKAAGARDTYYSVKEVITPELVKLDNDLIVRLIGVKEKQAVHHEAVAFLIKKTKGKQVFLRFDDQMHDDHSHKNQLCYLYLKNKTFINAHLIKAGLADVDRLSDFRYKKKFLLLGGMDG